MNGKYKNESWIFYFILFYFKIISSCVIFLQDTAFLKVKLLVSVLQSSSGQISGNPSVLSLKMTFHRSSEEKSQMMRFVSIHSRDKQLVSRHDSFLCKMNRIRGIDADATPLA
jgi:hypothetical protein